MSPQNPTVRGDRGHRREAAASVEFLGHVLGVGAGIFSLPVVGARAAAFVTAKLG